MVEEEIHTCTLAAAEVIYICTHGEVEVEVEMHACTLEAAEAICICTHIEVEGVEEMHICILAAAAETKCTCRHYGVEEVYTCELEGVLEETGKGSHACIYVLVAVVAVSVDACVCDVVVEAVAARIGACCDREEEEEICR